MTSYVHSNTDSVILFCLHLSSFRTPEKESISKAVLQKSRGRSQLWAHSKEPLKQPLLKRACTDPDLRDLACQAFIDILWLFSLGPENTQGKEELATSTKLASIEIIPHPHYRGYVYIKVGYQLCFPCLQRKGSCSLQMLHNSWWLTELRMWL